MSSDPVSTQLTPDELALRKKQVRKWVLVRAMLLGVMVSAWWILFAPDSIVAGDLKYILGVLAGLVASGFYLYNLRASFSGTASKD